MARRNEVIALDDVPDNAEFAAPVLAASDIVLNNTLLKLPKRVSSDRGPLSIDNAITRRIPKLTIIASRIDIPFPFQNNFAYAIGNESVIISIKNISYMFDNSVGFSKGCPELETKNPHPLLPRRVIDSKEATGPMFIVC
jgi:hypothetical protein